jgi:hypothetical protein
MRHNAPFLRKQKNCRFVKHVEVEQDKQKWLKAEKWIFHDVPPYGEMMDCFAK